MKRTMKALFPGRWRKMKKSNDEIVLDLLKFYRDKLLGKSLQEDSPGRVFARFHLSEIIGRGRQGKPADIQNWEAAYPWEEKIEELTKAANKAIL